MHFRLLIEFIHKFEICSFDIILIQSDLDSILYNIVRVYDKKMFNVY